MKKFICILLTVILCISLVSCKSREAQIDEAIVLNWESVHNQLISNPVKTKDKYDRKIVSWTANVVRINSDSVDMSNDGWTNQISVHLSKDDMMELKPGQTVTVVGKLKLSENFGSEIVNAFIVD